MMVWEKAENLPGLSALLAFTSALRFGLGTPILSIG